MDLLSEVAGVFLYGDRMPRAKRNPRLGEELLFSLSVSNEEAVRRIREEYPPEMAVWLARRELQLRKEAKEKQREVLTHDSCDFGFTETETAMEEYREMIPERQSKETQKYVWELIESRAKIHFHKFNGLGKGYTLNDVLSEVGEVFWKCQKAFKEGRASFETYFDNAIKNHAKTLWKKRNRDLQGMEEYRTDVLADSLGEYPTKVNGKWVQTAH